MNPIYLDYNATTPVDPRVADAIDSALRELWGNPSSSHAYGRAAHDAVETARGQVAALLGATPGEIVFTGGGSEASNAAIKGVCLARPRGIVSRLFGQAMPHVITSSVEHPATAKPLEYLRKLGVSVTVLDVDRYGLLDPDDVRRAIRPNTRLVTVMHSNNETGTLMPVREIGNICRERGVLFHTDCAQSVGKVPVDVREMFADLVTVAGHKLYAPKGVGALYVRDGVRLEPLVHGAGHESGRRAGTENTPYVVGLGVAATLALPTVARPPARGASGQTRRPPQPERPPGAAATEHAEPELPRSDRAEVAREGATGRGERGGGMPRAEAGPGGGDAVGGAVRDAGAAGGQPGGGAANRRPVHH